MPKNMRIRIPNTNLNLTLWCSESEGEERSLHSLQHKNPAVQVSKQQTGHLNKQRKKLMDQQWRFLSSIRIFYSIVASMLKLNGNQTENYSYWQKITFYPAVQVSKQQTGHVNKQEKADGLTMAILIFDLNNFFTEVASMLKTEWESNGEL
jgi:hypothetical protein